jgi:hypothetical protein
VSSNPTSTSTGRTGRRIPLRSGRGRAALAGAVILVALPVLAACSAGTNPEVYQIKPDNGGAQAGEMYISNVWVVLDGTSGNAEVIGQVANTDPKITDSTSLTSVAIGGVPLTIVPPADPSQLAPGVQAAADSVSIPGLGSVEFGQPGQPELQLPNADLTVGNNAQVVYTFSNGQSATVTAIVEPNSGLWASYNPNGANSVTATTTASGTATTTATGTAKATGTATTTASSTATTTP